MRTETITYYSDHTKHKGYIVFPEYPIKNTKPAIIVAHAWMGQDDFAREKAQQLAKLGYVGFAADLYGDGATANNPEEATALMLPLFLDRKLLRTRIRAAYDEVIQNPAVDSNQIGAIGFCFGGLTVIELYRSGTPVKGVVSFHGLLGNALGDNKAKTVPLEDNIKGSILMLHGHDDPLVSQKDILQVETEFTKARVDWQLHIYGNTSHAFTNPAAHDTERGLIYNATAEKRAWQSMQNFFQELFTSS